ncbi:ABC transporter permease [Candidatus Poriferisocius sp.]|uniref:ABC transporter permease n=1 Tax=Candidatus Poriferisocius sp. TaxID=3101276 RepID=UPI003B5A4620
MDETPTTTEESSGDHSQAAPDAGQGLLTRAVVSLPESAALLFVLAALILYFSLASQYFFDFDNFVNIAQNSAVIGIIAMPATILLIGGQVDLSVGSVAGLLGMTMAVATTATDATTTPYGFGVGIALALLITIGIALLIGMFNGFTVTKIGLNSLIVTLGGLAMFRGLTKVLGDGQTIRLNGFGDLGVSRPLFDIPTPVYIFLGVTIACHLLLKYTVYGRSVYAVGANPHAARLAGIRTERVLFIAFVISALATAMAGLIRVSQVGSAATNSGAGFELTVVTAIILGGASLSGGRGSIIGTFLALLVLNVLENGLIQTDVPTFWIEFSQGALLVIAVSFDRLRVRLSSS